MGTFCIGKLSVYIKDFFCLSSQLGEAILSTPIRSNRNSIASFESIFLTDRRTWGSSTPNSHSLPEDEDESQFLIGEDEGSIPFRKLRGNQPPDRTSHNFRGSQRNDSHDNAQRLFSNDQARRSDVFSEPVGIGYHENGIGDDTEAHPLPRMTRGTRRGEGSLATKAGIILVSLASRNRLLSKLIFFQGVHNVAIVIPQFLST
jgi:hypothetical protein